MSHRCANVGPCDSPRCHVCNVDVSQHVAVHDDSLKQKLREQNIRHAEATIADQAEELERLHAELSRLRHRHNQLSLQQEQWARRRELMQGMGRTKEKSDAGWELHRLWNEMYRMSFDFRGVLRAIEDCEAFRDRVEKRLDVLVSG